MNLQSSMWFAVSLVVGGIVFGGVFGWFICIWQISRDRHWMRVGEDEVVVKAPRPGTTLVCVSQDTVRRIAGVDRGGDPSSAEARNLYPQHRLKVDRK